MSMCSTPIPIVRAVVIRGVGERLYIVGADIGEMDAVSAREQRGANAVAWLSSIHPVLNTIERSPKVYISAMKGRSYGGGLRHPRFQTVV